MNENQLKVRQHEARDKDKELEMLKGLKTVGETTVPDPRMTCRNVDVHYGESQAIFNVSLDIGRNEVKIGRASCRERG